MAEELKRRGRLATALIAGPALTVGLLGTQLVPASAEEDGIDNDQGVEDTDEVGTGEGDEGSDGEGDGEESGESDEDDDADEDSEGEDADGSDDDSESEDDESEEPGDDEGSDDLEEDPEEEDESSDEGDEVAVTAEGSLVEISGLPSGASSITVAHGEETVSAGHADEDGNLTFEAADYIGMLGLEPGENELTISWNWYEDNEQHADSADVTVEIDAPEEGEINFEVDGPVVTATGFPEEGFVDIDVEDSSGNTVSAYLDEDRAMVFDASNAFGLELGFGPQTLTFTWTWNDPDFGEQGGTEEVVVTVTPALETVEDLTIEEIIAGLVGDDTEVENVQSIGEDFQIGRFSGWDALGIPAGIVLSTGDLLSSWEAMTGTGSGSFNDNLSGDGDSDLGEILEGSVDEGIPGETQDAAGVEFSFVPQEANVRFSYVFASDEYLYLDGSDEPGGSVHYNDIFAFFVNGQNYALFETADGDTLPVSIENINSVANSELYNDNLTNEDGERPNSGTEIGGYTNVLTFTAPVNPGELNTLKLVVADVNDGIYDSFVVLQSGSFEQVEGPVVQGGEFYTDQGVPVGSDFDLNTNSDDPEWSITVTDGIDEEAGELEVDGTSWEFTPAEDFVGEVSFTFTGNDGSLNSAPATITITVGAEDDDDDDDGEDTTPPEDDDDDSTPPEDEGDESTDPDEDDESTTPEEDEDDGSTGPAGDTKGPEGDEDEGSGKGGDEEELAKTGFSGTTAGLLSGLLLALGGALAIFGYRGRFSGKQS